jgi:hypothetical protein
MECRWLATTEPSGRVRSKHYAKLCATDSALIGFQLP